MDPLRQAVCAKSEAVASETEAPKEHNRTHINTAISPNAQARQGYTFVSPKCHTSEKLNFSPQPYNPPPPLGPDARRHAKNNMVQCPSKARKHPAH
jgi:hypothetical protein